VKGEATHTSPRIPLVEAVRADANLIPEPIPALQLGLHSAPRLAIHVRVLRGFQVGFVTGKTGQDGKSAARTELREGGLAPVFVLFKCMGRTLSIGSR
jgi:hypothetical protein